MKGNIIKGKLGSSGRNYYCAYVNVKEYRFLLCKELKKNDDILLCMMYKEIVHIRNIMYTMPDEY